MKRLSFKIVAKANYGDSQKSIPLVARSMREALERAVVVYRKIWRTDFTIISIMEDGETYI